MRASMVPLKLHEVLLHSLLFTHSEHMRASLCEDCCTVSTGRFLGGFHELGYGAVPYVERSSGPDTGFKDSWKVPLKLDNGVRGEEVLMWPRHAAQHRQLDAQSSRPGRPVPVNPLCYQTTCCLVNTIGVVHLSQPSDGCLQSAFFLHATPLVDPRVRHGPHLEDSLDSGDSEPGFSTQPTHHIENLWFTVHHVSHRPSPGSHTLGADRIFDI